MNMTKLGEYVALKRRKKVLDAELRSVNRDIEGLQESLLDQFADAGVNKMGLDGGVTVYVHPQLWANAKEDERDLLVAALREADLAEYTTVNTQSLSGLVRELAKQAGIEKDDEIDMSKVAPWGEHVKVTRKMTLNVLGANGKDD